MNLLPSHKPSESYAQNHAQNLPLLAEPYILDESSTKPESKTASLKTDPSTDDGYLSKFMSYFRTREVGWRPTLVTPPHLYLFAAITLCCVISLEITFQLSQPHGELTFNKSPFIEGLVENGANMGV
jgi:hypothetical protein